MTASGLDLKENTDTTYLEYPKAVTTMYVKVSTHNQPSPRFWWSSLRGDYNVIARQEDPSSNPLSQHSIPHVSGTGTALPATYDDIPTQRPIGYLQQFTREIMLSRAAPHHQSSSSILFESPDKSIVLIDIPRSIEDAQLLPGQTVKRRIISSSPVKSPWKTPEPRKGLTEQTSPSASISELMTLESVKAALQEIQHSHKGSWCLPRVSSDAGKAHGDELHSEESRKRKQISPGIEDTNTTPGLYIPDQARYFLGTIESQREAFLTNAPTFDLIVLDPPWPSRSVKRKQDSYTIAYGMQEARDLLTQIPVASHLKPDGLVAIWVTNKAVVTDLLTSPGGIFSEWGLELVGEWIWLKITSSGDPIIDPESQWRKPWERLLLGRKRGSTLKQPISTKVILGVPDIHSRKPNLKHLFHDMMPENYNGLEVFARNLTAGWWSWGNEVLYFQQKKHWVETTDNDTEQV